MTEFSEVGSENAPSRQGAWESVAAATYEQLPSVKPSTVSEKPAGKEGSPYGQYLDLSPSPYGSVFNPSNAPIAKPAVKPEALASSPADKTSQAAGSEKRAAKWEPVYGNPYAQLYGGAAANPYEPYVVAAKPVMKPADKPATYPSPYDAHSLTHPYGHLYGLQDNPYGAPAQKPLQTLWQFPRNREVPQREYEHVVGDGEAEIRGNYIHARRWREDGRLRREVFFDHSTRDRCISRAVDYHADGRTVAQEVAFRPEMYVYSRHRSFAENGQQQREVTWFNDGRSIDTRFRNGRPHLSEEYDRENRVTARHIRENNGWTSRHYNAAGEVTQSARTELSANDRVTRATVSDGQGRIQQEWRYRPNGQRESYTEYYQNGNPRRQIAYGVDGRSTETNYRSDGTLERLPVRGTVAGNYTFTRQDGTLEHRNPRGQVVRSERDGVATVYSYDARGNQTMARQDAPVRTLPFRPILDEIPAAQREQHRNFLDRRADDLLRTFADRQGRIDFQQHGRMLSRLAEQPDLTERDRLHILQHIVDEYNREPNRRFHLNRAHAAPETLNSFSADRLRHQVVGPADSYHPPLGTMTDTQVAMTIANHEGPLKMAGNLFRLAMGWDGGGVGFNQGDATASVYQAACWRQYLQNGFRGYATMWNSLYVR